MLKQINRILFISDLFRIVSYLFSPHTSESFFNLKSIIKDFLKQSEPVCDNYSNALRDIYTVLEQKNLKEMEYQFNALFLLGAQVSIYEGGYQQVERGTIVGDVAGFYKAFGVELKDQSGPPDSLWNELSFVSWLLIKEVHAWQHDLSEQKEITQKALKSFLTDHLARWVGDFSYRLKSATEDTYWLLVSDLLIISVSLILDEYNISDIKVLSQMPMESVPEKVECPVSYCAEKD